MACLVYDYRKAQTSGRICPVENHILSKPSTHQIIGILALLIAAL